MNIIDEYNKKRVLLVNHVSLVLSFLGIPYFLCFYYLGYKKLSFMILPFIALFLLTILFNKFKKFKVAFFSLIFTPSVAIFSYASILGKSAGIQIVLIGVSLLAFILFLQEGSKLLFLSVLIPVLSYLLLELTNYSLIQMIFISNNAIALIYYISLFSTFSIMFYVLFFNLTESKKYAKELLKVIKDLEMVNEELKVSKNLTQELAQQSAYASLTRGIAHEIKNPLHMLMGRAELLKVKLQDKEFVSSFADSVLKNVDRLHRLIKVMLDYGNQSNLEKEVFLANDILNDIKSLAHFKSREKQIQLKVEESEELYILGSKTFIYQAILNLVANSIQYTNANGQITLFLNSCQYKTKNNELIDGVEIVIQDTGIGISVENIKKIFDPYFTTKDSQSNVGLGLSIAFKTVIENDGDISCESELGKGTRFLIYLPKAKKPSFG